MSKAIRRFDAYLKEGDIRNVPSESDGPFGEDTNWFDRTQNCINQIKNEMDSGGLELLKEFLPHWLDRLKESMARGKDQFEALENERDDISDEIERQAFYFSHQDEYEPHLNLRTLLGQLEGLKKLMESYEGFKPTTEIGVPRSPLSTLTRDAQFDKWHQELIEYGYLSENTSKEDFKAFMTGGAPKEPISFEFSSTSEFRAFIEHLDDSDDFSLAYSPFQDLAQMCLLQGKPINPTTLSKNKPQKAYDRAEAAARIMRT